MPVLNSFAPKGQTYLLGTSSIQIPSNSNGNFTTYRVKNIVGALAYFRWAPPLPDGTAVTVGAVTAPSAGVPQPVIGVASGAVEFFTLPANAWFLSATVGGFEITVGE